MLELKYRLRRESTVIATQSAMGTVEDIYRIVFPDSRIRPTFLIGTMSHNFWEAPADASNYQLKKDHLEQILTHERVKQASYTLVYSGLGAIRLGPIAVVPGTEMIEDMKRREGSAKYLVDRLIDCKQLGAKRVDQITSLNRRLAMAVKAAVLGPMTALQGCKIGAIFNDEQWRRIGLDLIKEAWMVIRHDLPGGISLKKVTEWATHDMYNGPDDVHSTLMDMMDGRETDVKVVNGWFVKSGKLHTPPVHCHTHQAMMDQVKARAVQIKKQLMLQKSDDKTKAKQRGEGNFNRLERNVGGGHERLDKVEVIRMKKEKRRKQFFGNQPIPEGYTAPSISPLGNSKLRRE
ncbi:hypothetical protein N431DRAFT_476675 [Stipitochalara longipes BDJ]|nr:hypothetical protein N431DRAFT_476675 [Stipitochalara longipes BDJ]